jgi:signal transduction histidine kinase
LVGRQAGHTVISMWLAARLLPPVLRRPGPARDATPAAATGLVAVGLAAADHTVFGHLAGVSWQVVAGVQLAGAASLLVRRRAPLPVAAANAALSVVAATLAAAPAVYAAIAYGKRRRLAWTVAFAMMVITARPWALGISRTPGDVIMVRVEPVLLLVMVAAGLGVRYRRALARTARETRERELLAERARAGERARLAAEMHDVITHRVSLMVLQAGALQVSTTDETVHRQADQLRRSGRQALEELRDLLSVIRGEAPPSPARPAEPALVDLSDLVAASSTVGIPVELVGEAAPRVASPAVARTAYRVVQEALTNVRKHAPGASVRLEVRHEDGRLRITIANTAGSRSSHLDGTGSRGGLYGLRQRVELVDGTLAAGPRPGGGFEVRAELPAGEGTG